MLGSTTGGTRPIMPEEEQAADRGEQRQAAGAIRSPSDVGSAMRRSEDGRDHRRCVFLRSKYQANQMLANNTAKIAISQYT